MAIPKYQEIQKPILEFLGDKQIHTLKEIKSYVCDYFKMSEEDIITTFSSGRQTIIDNRVGWARTYLKKAGLIDSPMRANFVITEAGEELLRENLPAIDNKILRRYDSFLEFINMSVSDNGVGAIKEEAEQTPDDIIEEAYQKIMDNLIDDVLSEVMKISPVSFEKLVLDLLEKMGYGTFTDAAAMTATSGDGGIDGIIKEDKLGFGLIYTQAKQWKRESCVGRPEIQAFVGAIAGKGGKGLFVTTARFSRQAIEYAKQQHIILVDGRELAKRMIEHDFGVSTKQVFEIKTLDTDLFNEY